MVCNIWLCVASDMQYVTCSMAIGHLQSLAIQQQAMNSGAGLGMQTGGTNLGIEMEVP